jgi:hypothetical protein
VEGLGGIFSGFSAEGVGGGVILGRNRVPRGGVEKSLLIIDIESNLISIICIREESLIK